MFFLSKIWKIKKVFKSIFLYVKVVTKPEPVAAPIPETPKPILHVSTPPVVPEKEHENIVAQAPPALKKEAQVISAALKPKLDTEKEIVEKKDVVEEKKVTIDQPTKISQPPIPSDAKKPIVQDKIDTKVGETKQVTPEPKNATAVVEKKNETSDSKVKDVISTEKKEPEKVVEKPEKHETKKAHKKHKSPSTTLKKSHKDKKIHNLADSKVSPNSPLAMKKDDGKLKNNACVPVCKYECEKQECEQDCRPKCEMPKCETRCDAIDYSKCTHVSCDKPHCALFCPKNTWCNNQTHQDCPRPVGCGTQCAEPVCKLHCDVDVNCHQVCQEPRCAWECKKPTDCPAPKCSMKCQVTDDCSEVHELPALKPKHFVVQNFTATKGDIATWQATEWEPCEGHCQKSVQKREVRCSTGKDDDCDASKKPLAIQACHNHEKCGPMCIAHFYGQDNMKGWEAAFTDGTLYMPALRCPYTALSAALPTRGGLHSLKRTMRLSALAFAVHCLGEAKSFSPTRLPTRCWHFLILVLLIFVMWRVEMNILRVFLFFHNFCRRRVYARRHAGYDERNWRIRIAWNRRQMLRDDGIWTWGLQWRSWYLHTNYASFYI